MEYQFDNFQNPVDDIVEKRNACDVFGKVESLRVCYICIVKFFLTYI